MRHFICVFTQMERTKAARGRRGLEWHRKDRMRRGKKCILRSRGARMDAFSSFRCRLHGLHSSCASHSNEIALERRVQFTYVVARERRMHLQDRPEIFRYHVRNVNPVIATITPYIYCAARIIIVSLRRGSSKFTKHPIKYIILSGLVSRGFF